MFQYPLLKNKLLAAVIFVAAIACTQQTKKQEGTIASLPFYNTPNFTPLFISQTDSVKQYITHSIDSFSCINQNGNSITQNTVKGKIHVANFIFTTCASICPTMTNNFKMLEKAFYNHKQVEILSFSVTPWIDSVAVLKKYIAKNNITTNNWHFLTGNQAHIYAVARKQYFAEEHIGFTKDSTEFLHTEHAILVDKNMKIRGIYNATLPLEIQQMIADIQLLLTTDTYTLTQP